jgi:tetratricopeptide (TPR) repeat protein
MREMFLMNVRKYVKIKFLIIIFFAICIILTCFYLFFFNKTEHDPFFKENIRHYSKLLKKEPNNCFYLDQIASSYSALNNFDQAIKYYKKLLIFCPNDEIAQFQLGVCYYLIMEKDLGLEWMNKAIETAEKAGDDKLATKLKTSKASWLEIWDLVKEMDWNKSRNKQKK